MKNILQQFSVRIRTRQPRYARAFSLHDALVTLTVVSSVTTVAVPSFQQLTSSQRISSSVNSLITALHLARSEAIKRGEEATLCPSADGRTCSSNSGSDTVWEKGYLIFIDRDGNHDVSADEMAIQIFDAATGLHIRSSTHRDHVTYQPSGLASGTNLSFTFCDKYGRSSPRAVIVSNSGRPRSSTRNAGGSAISCPAAS